MCAILFLVVSSFFLFPLRVLFPDILRDCFLVDGFLREWHPVAGSVRHSRQRVLCVHEFFLGFVFFVSFASYCFQTSCAIVFLWMGFVVRGVLWRVLWEFLGLEILLSAVILFV